MPLQRAITYTDPVIPLDFLEKAKRKPKKKNLKVTRLLKKMGGDFSPQWMSIKEPQDVDRTKVQMSDDQV
jgi:hypothetical protein